MARRVGEHVDPAESLHSEGLVRIDGVVKPVWTLGTSAKVPLGRAPFLLQDTFHLRLEGRAQGLPEDNPQQHQQDGEKEYVADGQAEAQPARKSQSLAESVHDDCSTCFSTGFSALSGASSMYPIPRTVWIILTGNLSSILLRRWRMYTSTILVRPS